MTRKTLSARRQEDDLDPRMASTATARELPPTWRLRLRRLPLALRLGTLGVLMVGLSGLADRWRTAPAGGLDVLLLIDVSQSMLAQDEKPDRIGAATRFAAGVIQARPLDRFGLLLFAGEDALACPLTTDHQAVLERLSAVGAGGGSGTAIGTAMLGSLKRLREPRDGAVLLVLTDGASNTGDRSPLEAARVVSHANVRTFIVGVGRTGSAPFPTEAGLVDLPTEVNEAAMREMTETVGGLFVRAGDPRALTDVIDALAGVPSARSPDRREATASLWPAILTGLLLSLELVVAVLVLEIRS